MGTDDVLAALLLLGIGICVGLQFGRDWPWIVHKVRHYAWKKNKKR